MPIRVWSVLMACAIGAAASSSPRPKAQEEYSLASVRGTYALSYVFTAFRANDSAALALAAFDGNGSFTGSFIQNWPGRVCRLSRRVRCIAPGTNVGTYTMNGNGMGHVTLMNTFTGSNPGSSATELSFDGVVARAEVVKGVKLATEIFNIQAERPFVANIGGLASGVAKRLPDGGVFTTASLEGTYAVSSPVGAIPAGTLGVATFDGNGNVSSTLTVNLPAARADRQVIRGITGVGNYGVESNGAGFATFTSTLPDGSSLGESNFDFIVTEARALDTIHLATEVFAVGRERGALSRRLVVLVYTRLPD